MFNNYVQFVSRSVENLFGTTISFNGYFSSVIGAIVLILGAILLLGGNALIFQLPVYFKYNFLYGKECRKHLKEIDRLDMEECVDNKDEKIEEEYRSLELIIKNKKKRTIFFNIALIVLYIPIVLPIIITILDVAKSINIIFFVFQIILIIISLIMSFLGLFAVDDNRFKDWLSDNFIDFILSFIILIFGAIILYI